MAQETETAELLDLDACVENLTTYVAAGDARSCRDIALAVVAENQRLRGNLTFIRDVCDNGARELTTAGYELNARPLRSLAYYAGRALGEPIPPERRGLLARLLGKGA